MEVSPNGFERKKREFKSIFWKSIKSRKTRSNACLFTTHLRDDTSVTKQDLWDKKWKKHWRLNAWSKCGIWNDYSQRWKNPEEEKKNDTIAFITNAANAEKLCPSPSANHVCDLVPQAHDSPLRFGYNSSLILWKASVNASKTGHYTLSLWDPAL